MVMQLADGGELYDRLTTEGFALDDREVRSLLRDTADALGFLHDRSIVHGDLKPENLLLTASNTPAGTATSAAASLGGNQAAAAAVTVATELRQEAGRGGGRGGEAVAEGSEGRGAVGKVLLADFGSSFRMRGDGSGGIKTVKEYTVAYSAPEVVDHSPEISAKADVWSLGVIAYVMVSGQNSRLSFRAIFLGRYVLHVCVSSDLALGCFSVFIVRFGAFSISVLIPSH